MKKKLYLILSILTLISFFSSAALCSLGQPQDSEETKQGQEESQSKVTKEESSGSGKTSDEDKKPGGSNDKDKKDSGGSADSKNSPPVINSIGMDNDVVLANMWYELTSDVSDPDNNTISYRWSSDGGTFDKKDSATIIWTAPGFPETYHITLDVNDGKGGSDSMTKAVRVEEIQNVDNSPVISDIEMVNYLPGVPVPADTVQRVIGHASDPNSNISSYGFSVSGGAVIGQSGNEMDWHTPAQPGIYSVTFTVEDEEGNTATLTEEFTIVISKG